MHRRALRDRAASRANERNRSRAAGGRHVLRRVCGACRKAAGAGGPRHQRRSDASRRRICVQPERTGVRPDTDGRGQSGRQPGHSIRGCGRLAVHGFFGRVLHFDLTSGQSAYHEVEESRLRKYLGGIGLGTTLLYQYAPAGVDSLSSSHFALELKRLGIDGLVITGQAPSLAYLYINGQHVEMRAAEHLRGKTPDETHSIIRSEPGCSTVWVASIGAAGENRVRFATISNEGRHAGRGGVGAVMGAKNLKAIAVCGDRATSVAYPKEVETIADSLRRRSVSSVTDKYRGLGTVANLAVFNRLGTLPTRNFQQATFEHADALSGERLTETTFSRRHGCASCTIRCERLFKSRTGEEQRLEYETLFAVGPLCGISDADCVLQAARLCDDYGLEVISTGGTLSWAIEAAEKGLLPEARALGLRFGNADGVLTAIQAIAERRGIGALLAEGSRRAAMETGGGSSYWAMHVKGLELPGYDPRSLKTMALGLAVSPRGACHNRAGAYEADFSREVDRFRGDSRRGAIVAASEDFAAVLDSLIVCKFLRKCFSDFYTEAAEILARVTGWEYTGAEMRRAGERIHTLKKLFNIREGWRPDSDWLPERLLRENLPTGMARGVGLSPDELENMIRGC